MATALLLVLLAPEPAHTLEYRFEKGMAYDDVSSRHFTLELIAGEKLVRFETEVHQEMRRTVVAVDGDGLPLIERIEVKRFVKVTKDAPNDSDLGEKAYPSQGKTFVWRKKDGDEGWGLYGRKGEVTKKYPFLVERLANWRDARLPGKPVAVGATWEVSAQRFLQTVGQRAPEGVKGKAVFTLEGVADGVASIAFDFGQEHKDGERVLTGSQKGKWRFDVANGRDLALEMEGKVRIDNGRGGVGTFRMQRTLSYSGDS